MSYTLRDDSDAPEQQDSTGSGAAQADFQVSATPVGTDAAAASATGDFGLENAALPRIYGSQTLTLMPRDPRSLFAYWDIDWRQVFPEEQPRERQVQLRIFDETGAPLQTLEIEAMAGSCYVDVPEGGASYSGEIGYLAAAGEWIPVAQAEAVITPPDELAGGDATDFATVPFHLSFQRMIDLLRVTKHENGSLTQLLGSLREKVAAAEDEGVPLTKEQQEFARVLEETEAFVPYLGSEGAPAPDLWVQQKLERVLGFGGSSPAEGFGGSSRPL